jgi:hypothetical protein
MNKFRPMRDYKVNGSRTGRKTRFGSSMIITFEGKTYDLCTLSQDSRYNGQDCHYFGSMTSMVWVDFDGIVLHAEAYS